MRLRQDHIGGYHCGATKTPDRYSAWLIGAWSTLRSSLFISVVALFFSAPMFFRKLRSASKNALGAALCASHMYHENGADKLDHIAAV